MELFEWDENKCTSNFRKHGIDFPDAVFLFDDEYRMEWQVERGSELRFVTLGEIADYVVLVVYVKRGIKKRIISARRASKNERKKYEKNKETANEGEN
jgi:uncharacterized DUF497 family protein